MSDAREMKLLAEFAACEYRVYYGLKTAHLDPRLWSLLKQRYVKNIGGEGNRVHFQITRAGLDALRPAAPSAQRATGEG